MKQARTGCPTGLLPQPGGHPRRSLRVPRPVIQLRGSGAPHPNSLSDVADTAVRNVIRGQAPRRVARSKRASSPAVAEGVSDLTLAEGDLDRVEVELNLRAAAGALAAGPLPVAVGRVRAESR